jgi:hypothetical protein
MAAGITGAPKTDAGRINFRASLKVGDGATPIRYLSPWIDVAAELPAARPEIAMIVNKYNEAGRRECLGKAFKTVFLGSKPCAIVIAGRRLASSGRNSQAPSSIPPSAGILTSSFDPGDMCAM